MNEIPVTCAEANRTLFTYSEFLDMYYCLTNCDDKDLRDSAEIIALCSYSESGMSQLTSERYFKEKFKGDKLKYFEPKTLSTPSFMIVNNYTFLDEVLDNYWRLCEIDIDKFDDSKNGYENILYLSDSKTAFLDIIDSYELKKGKILIQVPPLEFKEKFNKFLKRYVYLSGAIKDIVFEDKLLEMINVILRDSNLSVYNETSIVINNDHSIKLLFKNFIENWKTTYIKFLKYQGAIRYKTYPLDFDFISHLFTETSKNIIVNQTTHKFEFRK